MMRLFPPRVTIAQLEPKRRGHFIILFLLLGLFSPLATWALAMEFSTDEDRSRFKERLYDKAEPGMRTPAQYVAIAKKAAHSQLGSDLAFADFADGIVSYRTYRDAPKSDREIISVAFVYKGSMGGNGMIDNGFFIQHAAPERPIILVLMRRDLSKIYVNLVHIKRK